MLPKEIQDKVDIWLNGNYDQFTKDTLKKMCSESEKEVIDSFYKDLSFGTGGLRGIMGVGTNRINKYTISMATQGLAQYLKQCFSGEKISVVIAYDSRNNSKYFSEVAAKVFAANGIKVYVFLEMRPTPLLSFAIRHLKTHSGVVITASHNPKEYNGYKAYWQDGAQVVSPHDINIITEVQKITDINQVHFQDSFENITFLDDTIENIYLQQVKTLSLNPELIEKLRDSLQIVYTPIHGTGITLVPKALQLFGFKNVHLVEEQAEPNGDFPTVVYPNPEESEALKLGLKKLKEIDGDILVGTDPDTDRIGIAVKNLEGHYQLLNGNQTAALVLYYILNQRQKKKLQKQSDFIAKTIVTTDLIKQIADNHKVLCYDTLTGFKYIADIIRKVENELNYIGGAEESYGLMIGDFIRDKDAVSATALVCEMVCFAQERCGGTFNMLVDLYKEYGFYKDKLLSITKKGKVGAESIVAMMENWRNNPPTHLGKSPIKYVKDYLKQESINLISGQMETINLPTSNVLQFISEDGSKLSARPSGTEPKIKFYVNVVVNMAHREDYNRISQILDGRIDGILDGISKLF